VIPLQWQARQPRGKDAAGNKRNGSQSVAMRDHSPRAGLRARSSGRGLNLPEERPNPLNIPGNWSRQDTGDPGRCGSRRTLALGIAVASSDSAAVLGHCYWGSPPWFIGLGRRRCLGGDHR